MGYYKILRLVRNLIYRLLSALWLMKTINIGGGVELTVDEYLQQHASERHVGVDYKRIASILYANGFGYIKIFPAVADYIDESAYKQMVQNNLMHHWGLIAKRRS